MGNVHGQQAIRRVKTFLFITLSTLLFLPLQQVLSITWLFQKFLNISLLRLKKKKITTTSKPTSLNKSSELTRVPPLHVCSTQCHSYLENEK